MLEQVNSGIKIDKQANNIQPNTALFYILKCFENYYQQFAHYSLVCKPHPHQYMDTYNFFYFIFFRKHVVEHVLVKSVFFLKLPL